MRRWVAAGLLLVASASAAAQEAPASPERTAPQWLEDLRSGDVPARKKAVYALWKMGPSMKEGVADLGTALSDPDPYVADVAARILMRLGLGAADAVDGAIAAFEDDRPKVRLAAVRLIQVIGEKAVHASGSLLSRLDDEDVEVRRAAASTFGTLGYFMGGSGMGSQAVAGLRGLLEDPDPGVRKDAAFALSTYGGNALPAVGDLVARLKDEVAEVRAFAANALWILGTDSGKEALDGLYGILGDPDGGVRSCVYGAIVALGPEDPRLFDAMRAGMNDSDSGVRQTCSWILGNRFADRPGVVDLLLAATDDNFRFVRTNALVCLSKMKPLPQGVFAALEKGLRDRDSQIRYTSTQCTWEVGPDAVRFVPQLVAMLRDTEDMNESVATIALGRIGLAAAEAIPDLRRRWKSRRFPYYRTAAGYSLARISPRDRPGVLGTFLAVLRGESSEFSLSLAAVGAGEIGPEAAEAVPLLRPLLQSRDYSVEVSAVIALGRIGPAAAVAVPDLEALKGDTRFRMADRVKEALASIRGDAGAAR